LLHEQGKLTEQTTRASSGAGTPVELPHIRAVVDLTSRPRRTPGAALAAANNLDFVDPVALDPGRELSTKSRSNSFLFTTCCPWEWKATPLFWPSASPRAKWNTAIFARVGNVSGRARGPQVRFTR